MSSPPARPTPIALSTMAGLGLCLAAAAAPPSAAPAGAAPSATPPPAPGAPAPRDELAGASRAFEIPFEKYTLPNDLEVILHRDPSLPSVAVNLWYHVGPANEPKG